MTIGLKRGTVHIEAYDPAWAAAFAVEKAALKQVLGNKLIAIEHIGSTSVAGLAAKPIIDMIAAVDSFDDIDQLIEPLRKLGYEYLPERMFTDRKFLPKGPPENRTHHLNLVLRDDPEQWVQPLAFRDYLRSHEAARQEYADVKRALAASHATDRSSYTAAKNDVIQSILKRVGPLS